MGEPYPDEPPLPSDREQALVDLAAATRRLCDLLITTDASTSDLRRAATVLTMVDSVLGARSAPRAAHPTPDDVQSRMLLYNPVIGIANPYAPPATFTVTGPGTVEGQVTLTAVHEGPPGSTHGGIVAMLLDQALGHAIAAAGAPGMTGSLTVRFRRPTPFDTDLVITARHTGFDGRKILAAAEVSAHGEVTAEATGVFLSPRSEHRRRFLDAVS